MRAGFVVDGGVSGQAGRLRTCCYAVHRFADSLLNIGFRSLCLSAPWP